MAEEMEIEVVERRKRVEIEEQEIIRNEKKLESTIRLPAEAEGYRVQTIAQGQRSVFCLIAPISESSMLLKTNHWILCKGHSRFITVNYEAPLVFAFLRFKIINTLINCG